jgi:hypothetical protein
MTEPQAPGRTAGGLQAQSVGYQLPLALHPPWLGVLHDLVT